jgi:hypothetical protein
VRIDWCNEQLNGGSFTQMSDYVRSLNLARCVIELNLLVEAWNENCINTFLRGCFNDLTDGGRRGVLGVVFRRAWMTVDDRLLFLGQNLRERREA